MLRTLGNIIWFLCGGIVMGLAWWLVGVLAFISIIGIPWGRACFVIGNFSFWPFGYEAISRDELTDQTDIGTSGFGVLGNIIWFILAGFGWRWDIFCLRWPVLSPLSAFRLPCSI